MSVSINRATLVGNLGGDPEIRSFQNGGRVATFSVATNEVWKDKSSGERRESVEWHKVEVFNEGLITFVENHLGKGSKVLVEGKIRTERWTDKEGVERFTTKITLGKFDARLILLDKLPGNEPGIDYGAEDETA
jgi:single-strand DNA-binding protein